MSPGVVELVRRSGEGGHQRLREQWIVGHHRLPGGLQLHVRQRRRSPPRPGDLHPAHPAEDPLLHSQPTDTLRPHIIPQRLCVLSPSRRWREDDYVHFHTARPHRIPAPRQQDPPSNLEQHSSHRQVSPVHLYHEHLHHTHHCHNHQLELSNSSNSPDVDLGQSRVPSIFAEGVADDAAQLRRPLGEKGIQPATAKIRLSRYQLQ